MKICLLLSSNPTPHPPFTRAASSSSLIHIFIHNMLSNISVVIYMLHPCHYNFHATTPPSITPHHPYTPNPPSSIPPKPSTPLHILIHYVMSNSSVVFYMFQPCIFTLYSTPNPSYRQKLYPPSTIQPSPYSFIQPPSSIFSFKRLCQTI